MMNVDDSLRIRTHELRRKNLHVTCENNEIHRLPLQQSPNLPFRRLLFFLLNRHQIKRNAVELRNGLAIRMIRNYARNIARQFPTLMAIKQIHQAMIVLGNQNRHSLANIRQYQPPLHVEFTRDPREVMDQIAQRKIQFSRIKLHPHQEGVGIVIAVFIGMKNVAAVLRNKSRDSSNNTFAIRAAEEKDRRLLHAMNRVTYTSYLQLLFSLT